MHYSALPLFEEKLKPTVREREYTFNRFSISVPNENLTLEGYVAAPKERSGYYYAVEHPKKHIVLHYTAGNIMSDLRALTEHNHHVSVAFVIARNGVIYQLFPSKYWSGHIGRGLGNIGTGNAEDKCSIGIELSNYGYLTKQEDNLETFYSRQKLDANKTTPVDIYCKLTEQEAYTKLNSPFRGQFYFATYTEDQYNSLIILLRYLTSKYNIRREFLPETIRYQTTEQVLNFNGIVSHINYRKVGKWDVGPAFEWNKVIENVRAEKYIPTKQKSVDLNFEQGNSKLYTSQEQIIELIPRPKDASFENEPYEEKTDVVDQPEGQEDKGKPKLYALLVGIADYASEIRLLNDTVRFPKLYGCVGDTDKIKNYLEEANIYNAQIRILKNEQATKKTIVEHFKKHFSQAGETDTILFYFSGHGTQEYTDKAIFRSETDGKLESLVCYYNEDEKEDFLLSDKELRWLMSQVAVAKSHMVCIFDCCHSSGVTRNSELVDKVFENVVEKRVDFVFPKRKWEDFIFSNIISQEEFLSKGELSMLPESEHLAFSACESNEAAVEVAGEGVFTKALLKVLKSAGGQVSYQMVVDRVRQYLRNVYEQKPRMYVAKANDNVIFSTFLNPGSFIAGGLGEVTFNSKVGWQLNMGAIHGINKSVNRILIVDPEKAGEGWNAKIKLIKTDSTELEIEGKLDEAKIYKTNITGLMSKVLRLHVETRNSLPEDQLLLLNTITEAGKDYLELVDNESNADYILRYADGNYFITFPGDKYRPLTELANTLDTNWVNNIVENFKHISKWSFIKNLINEDNNSKLPFNAVKVTVATGIPLGTMNPIHLENDSLTIPYLQCGGFLKNRIRINIRNTFDSDLYCCPIYLTSNFQSFTGYLNPNVYLLERNNDVTLNLEGLEDLDIIASEMMTWYNWQKMSDCLKFIVSTEPFDAISLKLDSLPEAPTPNHARDVRTAKGIVTSLPNRNSVKGWRTYDIGIDFINPSYNQIKANDLQLMLEDENTRHFALGLYYDAEVGGNLIPIYSVKPEITVVDEKNIEVERGVIRDTIIDIANLYARSKRNKHYKNVLTRFPDRSKIVSEGDSWFQHPLVLDIIDHVSKVYPVYCSAAAGDTLTNYISDDKKRGEYFLSAIEKQNPKFFLISGGGNDILGAQFKDFLIDEVNNKVLTETHPARFLKKSFSEKVKELMELYKTLFYLLQKQKPGLKIIVHGYDYPVKINDTKKGWLGRYMIERGILKPQDRKALMHYCLDYFNQELEETCKPFNNVHYLDVRNIVRYNEADKVDQWYDEIHPNDDGFQHIAMKFIQKITSLE